MRRIISFIVAVSMLFSSVNGYAQTVALPQPGAMVALSANFTPVILKGMVIHPDDPLVFDFVVDNGNTGLKDQALTEETTRLVKYFLAGIAIPEQDLWVNLSPVEKDRIIEQGLSQTDMGRDMLAQDYLLKQMVSSLIYPESDLGKAFWAKVYAQAQEKFGSTDVPVDTFNKVWIMPETATVYRDGNKVLVADAKLKVMMEKDYVAANQRAERVGGEVPNPVNSALAAPSSEISTQLMREVLIPVLQKEINEGANFAQIRQLFHSLILANYYKNTLKQSLLAQVYADSKKTNGIDIAEPQKQVETIYGKYVEAFKTGVFNYIKEDINKATGETVPHKYFSGGAVMRMTVADGAQLSRVARPAGDASMITYKMQNADAAQNVDPAMAGLQNIRDIVLTGNPDAQWKTKVAKAVISFIKKHGKKEASKGLSWIMSDMADMELSRHDYQYYWRYDRNVRGFLQVLWKIDRDIAAYCMNYALADRHVHSSKDILRWMAYELYELDTKEKYGWDESTLPAYSKIVQENETDFAKQAKRSVKEVSPEVIQVVKAGIVVVVNILNSGTKMTWARIERHPDKVWMDAFEPPTTYTRNVKPRLTKAVQAVFPTFSEGLRNAIVGSLVNKLPMRDDDVPGLKETYAATFFPMKNNDFLTLIADLKAQLSRASLPEAQAALEKASAEWGGEYKKQPPAPKQKPQAEPLTEEEDARLKRYLASMNENVSSPGSIASNGADIIRIGDPAQNADPAMTEGNNVVAQLTLGRQVRMAGQAIEIPTSLLQDKNIRVQIFTPEAKGHPVARQVVIIDPDQMSFVSNLASGKQLQWNSASGDVIYHRGRERVALFSYKKQDGTIQIVGPDLGVSIIDAAMADPGEMSQEKLAQEILKLEQAEQAAYDDWRREQSLAEESPIVNPMASSNARRAIARYHKFKGQVADLRKKLQGVDASMTVSNGFLTDGDKEAVLTSYPSVSEGEVLEMARHFDVVAPQADSDLRELFRQAFLKKFEATPDREKGILVGFSNSLLGTIAQIVDPGYASSFAPNESPEKYFHDFFLNPGALRTVPQVFMGYRELIQQNLSFRSAQERVVFAGLLFEKALQVHDFGGEGESQNLLEIFKRFSRWQGAYTSENVRQFGALLDAAMADQVNPQEDLFREWVDFTRQHFDHRLWRQAIKAYSEHFRTPEVRQAFSGLLKSYATGGIQGERFLNMLPLLNGVELNDPQVRTLLDKILTSSSVPDDRVALVASSIQRLPSVDLRRKLLDVLANATSEQAFEEGYVSILEPYGDKDPVLMKMGLRLADVGLFLTGLAVSASSMFFAKQVPDLVPQTLFVAGIVVMTGSSFLYERNQIWIKNYEARAKAAVQRISDRIRATWPQIHGTADALQDIMKRNDPEDIRKLKMALLSNGLAFNEANVRTAEISMETHALFSEESFDKAMAVVRMLSEHNNGQAERTIYLNTGIMHVVWSSSTDETIVGFFKGGNESLPSVRFKGDVVNKHGWDFFYNEVAVTVPRYDASMKTLTPHEVPVIVYPKGWRGFFWDASKLESGIPSAADFQNSVQVSQQESWQGKTKIMKTADGKFSLRAHLPEGSQQTLWDLLVNGSVAATALYQGNNMWDVTDGLPKGSMAQALESMGLMSKDKAMTIVATLDFEKKISASDIVYGLNVGELHVRWDESINKTLITFLRKGGQHPFSIQFSGNEVAQYTWDVFYGAIIFHQVNFPGQEVSVGVAQAVSEDKAQIQGGIDLRNGEFLKVIDKDASGMPVFDPAQIQLLKQDLKGFMPVPVSAPQPINFLTFLGLTDGPSGTQSASTNALPEQAVERAREEVGV